MSTSKKEWLLWFRFLIGFIVAIVISSFRLDYLESAFFDFRFRLRPNPSVTEHVATVMIEAKTVQELKAQPLIRHHLQVLYELAKQNPLAVIYVINPREITGTDQERRQFVRLARTIRNFYFVTKETELKGEEGRIRLPPPFQELPVFSGPITGDTFILAHDGVTRRLLLTYQGNLLLHPYLAAAIQPSLARPENIRGRFDLYDTDEAYIDFARPGSFPQISFTDLLFKRVPKGTLKDKIIFLGADLDSADNYSMTPFSRDVKAMNRVEVHANMIDTLLRNSAPIKAPQWINFLFTLAISIFTVQVVMTMTPTLGLTVLSILLASYFLLCYILFWPFGILLEMAHPFLSIFLCYYFFIPYRLIVENRRSWELYQKNKILTQVEELKNNFISMMSHDLKTPLARIQGMTEIIGRDSESLNENQRNAVNTIQQSSEDLVHLITSILNFSRIENQGIKLQLKSKDINIIIEDVIQKLQYHAGQKKIEIVTELEPLFSIKIDSELIRQVISNLIENAIKYSPENSKVMVITEERENYVVIQIADQGMGIPPEEIPQLFRKFYRAKNAKNLPVRGSGLGLYLAKYFIDLHQGSISVESQLKEGSTFTVKLPQG